MLTEPQSWPRMLLAAKSSIPLDLHLAGFLSRILQRPENTHTQRQTWAMIGRILWSKLQHANIFLHSAFCNCRVKKTSRKKRKGKKTKKRGSIHASQSPVGYYHVLNCDLQTQAVLNNKNKKKKQMVSFYILRNFFWMRASVPSLQLAFPMQMIRFLSFWEKFDPHPPSHSKCQNT